MLERQRNRSSGGEAGELVIFGVGDTQCAVDIRAVREINQNLDIYPVQLAPEYVRGVINLRGQIVTVIDLRSKLNLPPRPLDQRMRIVVVRSGEEDFGILVDRIEDVAPFSSETVEAPPPHVGAAVGRYLSGVHKSEDGLVSILDVEKLLRLEEAV